MMLGLEYFGFRELWTPSMLIVIVIIGILYEQLTGAWRYRFQHSEEVPFRKKVYFYIGLLLYYMAIGGPLNLLGHLIFSAHMLAMTFAYLIAPPLILLGLPSWLLRPLLIRKNTERYFRALTHPILALLLFNLLFSVYHMPLVHDFVMTNYTVHTLFYILLTLAAFMMWWVVLCPIPELDRLAGVRKMGYIFANGALLTPACALIIFADVPLYATYSDPQVWAQAMGYCMPQNTSAILGRFSGPDFFAIMPILEDQQLGGVLMKLIQEIVYGTALAFVFSQWYRKENPKNEIDPIDPEQQAWATGNALK